MLIFLLELRSRHRQWRFSSSCRRCTESHEEWRRCERHRSSLKIGDAVKDSYSYLSFVKPTLTAGCLCRISTAINLVPTISTKTCLHTKTDLYTSNKDAEEDSNPDIPAKVLIMSLELGLAGPAIQVIHTWFKSLGTNHGFSHNMNVCFKMHSFPFYIHHFLILTSRQGCHRLHRRWLSTLWSGKIQNSRF